MGDRVTCVGSRGPCERGVTRFAIAAWRLSGERVARRDHTRAGGISDDGAGV